MKKPIDPKEELLQQLAVSLLRDVFAAAAAAGMFAADSYGQQRDLADDAYSFADRMLVRSRTPDLIKKLESL